MINLQIEFAYHSKKNSKMVDGVAPKQFVRMNLSSIFDKCATGVSSQPHAVECQ
jgi:hypothetical protein